MFWSSKMENQKFSFGKLFIVLLIFNFDLISSKCVKHLDYDFIEADDLFARRNVPEESFPGKNNWTINITPQRFSAVPSTNLFTTPDSPIGYEVPCGIRGVTNATFHSLNINEHRIVGGIKAHPGEFPWQVSLQLISGWQSRHICGGTILSSYWVITAGHCVANLKPEALLVVAGENDLSKVEGTEQQAKIVRIVNAGYSQTNFSNDLALLQLSSPLRLDGKFLAPICLPNPKKKYLPGEYGLVSGWGKLSESGKLPHVLHFVKLPIIPFTTCHRLYDNINYGKFINKCQICCGYEQGGSDSCQGDSGGPLMCRQSDKRYYLCGLVSWGVGCARPNLPGVYTEVSCYSNWIKRILYNVDDIVSKLPPYL